MASPTALASTRPPTLSFGASLTALIVCAVLTLALVVAELVLGHFSHCLTLLAVTNQSVYNLLTIVFAAVAKKVIKHSGGKYLQSSKYTGSYLGILRSFSLTSRVHHLVRFLR